MPTPGYPDYSRLSQQGASLLYGTNTTPPVNTILFQGYVGAWPYVDLFTLATASTDFAQIVMEYYTDSTFTENVAFRYAIRDQYALGATQYANLSPWLRFYYESTSGNNFPFNQLSLYATSGEASPQAMSSNDVPLVYFNGSIAANSSETLYPGHTHPGNALFSMYTNSATWYVEPQYYDYASSSWLTLTEIGGTGEAAGSITQEVPILDAPMRFVINNSAAAADTFRVSVMSKQ